MSRLDTNQRLLDTVVKHRRGDGLKTFIRDDDIGTDQAPSPDKLVLYLDTGEKNLGLPRPAAAAGATDGGKGSQRRRNRNRSPRSPGRDRDESVAAL